MASTDMNIMIPYIENMDVKVMANSRIETEAQKKRIEFVYRKKPVYDFFKRVFDIVFSLVAIVVLSPIMLVIAAAIMIDDFGNPIFVQKRVGKNGAVFNMLKFRSMYEDAEKRRNELLKYNEADGPIFKLKEDPRVTRVGRIIRKYSADELVQLFNVLQGKMSIVGPRPFVTYEQEKFDEYQSQRLLVKPGLSCYWQAGGHHDASFDELIESDLRYIMERSFITDFKIIFNTVFVIFKSNGI